MSDDLRLECVEMSGEACSIIDIWTTSHHEQRVITITDM